MAVNLADGARVWAPFRELHDVVESAVTRHLPGAVHDLEMALRKHKPDFISLLKRPAKLATHRDLVKKSNVEGIPVQGEQRRQTFSQQFIAEALILSDLFDLNELAAVELLMAGELQLPNYPGLTRGLVAVILFLDGQRSLVASLRALAQARSGRTWTVGVSSEMQTLISGFVEELLAEGIVGTILDLIKSMDLVKEIDRLQKDRALGPPKHRKQVTDLYTEIRQTLGDVIFCLACQKPLNKQDTMRLMAHLRQDAVLNADETLDSVTLSLLVALWYCFDVSLLQNDDSEDILSHLPVFYDSAYVKDIHAELTSSLTWTNPGLKAAAQFAWAVLLRQTSQFNMGNGGMNGNSDCFEDDERLVDLALESKLFSFLSLSVVACSNFHSEEFFLRRLHGLVTDFIHQMPLKTKELRNRGDEMSRLILAHQAEGLEPPAQRGDFHDFLTVIGDLYEKDPLHLELALEYWSPPEMLPGATDALSNIRPDPKQVSLFKFVRVSGDLIAAPLFLPYVHMLTGLSTGSHCAYHCFSLLRVNGGQASPVSWDHMFSSLHQYFSSLRQAYGAGGDGQGGSGVYRGGATRSMTPQELEAVCSCLRLTRHIAEQNETCRSAFCENQQWSVVMVLFGLLSCSVPYTMKGEILRTMAAIAQTPVFAATIWQTLESSQILPTLPNSNKQTEPNSIKTELEEVESRNEEFPLTRGFLQLIGALTQFPVPLGLGAGTRVPGFDPYLDFVLNSVLLKYNTRAYKDAAEKWKVVCACLEILVKLLTDYQLSSEDVRVEAGDVPGVGGVPANSHPGFAILCLMLTNSQLFKTVQQILEEAVHLFNHFTPFPGRDDVEQASLLCLRLLEEAAERQASLEQRVRDQASPLMVSCLERLLLAINPRTRHADYLTNITRFVVFNTFLPKHASAAVRILCHVCQETASQSDIVNLFTADKSLSSELLQGFVECLDSNCPEEREERAVVLLNENDGIGADPKEPPVENVICEGILQLLLLSLDLAAPNMAHWLMGFNLQKPVVRTTLQDPGVLDSPKTCLHSVLGMLERGLGTREGLASLHDRPKLAELGYRLIYALAANRDTSAPTLRYLRTTHDFLFKQLQHLPLDNSKYMQDVSDHQSWLLRTAAIELRTTCVNRQRSHTQRLVRLLLGEDDQEQYNQGQLGDDGEMTITERESTLNVTQFNVTSVAKQMRNRFLGVLDTVSFDQPFLPSVNFTFFDREQVETLVRSLEMRTREGVAYCDVRALRKVLLTELANQQGPMVAGQRPHIMEEIQLILETVVQHNDCREQLQRKRRALDAWRQLLGVMLTSVPSDLLAGEQRQALLFDLLHELLIKVNADDVSLEATALVSDVLLTLMSNLRHCFQTSPTSSASFTAAASVSTAGDTSATQHPFWASGSTSGGNARTVFASSLQIVLKGLIDYILKSGGGIQKMRVNLYGALLYCLQIAKKDEGAEDLLSGVGIGRKSGMERLLYQDDGEYERLAAENMETISAYGETFMETVCRDACDGHHVGRMLALSVLDTVLSLDRQQAWLSFLCGRGYLQHLLDSLPAQDDQQLLALLTPQPANLRALYIFQSKMSLLTRVAQDPEGARTLLHSGALEKLASCSVLSLRPEVDDFMQQPDDDDEAELLPSPLARYRQILFAVLRFSLALLTSLGGENKEAATQVMLLVVSHSDVFTTILRNRKPTLNASYLRELSLTTAVVARANYHPDLGADLLEHDTASMEFRSQRMRLQDAMLALLPHYSTPDTVVKDLNMLVNSPNTTSSSTSAQAASDWAAQLLELYQQVASNITAYCRSLVSAVGEGSMSQHLLFGPSLEEITIREGSKTDELSVTLGVGRRLGVGVVLLLLQQSARQFSLVLDAHAQMSQKLASLTELTADDLKQLCGDHAVEKLSSHQRQEVARGRLQHNLAHKSRQIQHYVYIVESCLYVLWRHMEYYLVHCVPANPTSMTTPTLMRHRSGIRRLTGAGESFLDSSVVGSPQIAAGLSQAAMGVTRQDIDHLRAAAPAVLNDAFFKKVQHVDEHYGKERSHYSFTDAIVRKIRRVLKLHTGN